MNAQLVPTVPNSEILGGFFYAYRENAIARKKAVILNIYYIDEVSIDGNQVDVDYTLNDEWARVTIRLSDLKSFIIATGMHHYEFNYSDYSGNHTQDAGLLDVDTFLCENIKVAVRAYFEVNKIGQYNVN
jgi:hypothetical protein